MDLKPTEQMAKNAERGLKLRKEYNRGGTEVGVARATQLKNRENLSPETVKRMVSYFARHAGDNLSETDPPSAGYIAWLLWGGDAGRDWAERKAKQIDEQKENDMNANKSNSNPFEEIAVKQILERMGLLKDSSGKPTKTYNLAIEYVRDGRSGTDAVARALAKTGEKKQNSLTQKKLAVIKSNAAPEVKLKALEVLSNGMLEDYHKMTKAYQTGDKKTALEMAHKLAQSGWKDSARMKDVQHILKQLSNSYDNADSKLDSAKLALSKMLDQLGYKAMAREVMQESDIQALKKYARVVISEFEKAKSPKADRVKALLGQLGVGV